MLGPSAPQATELSELSDESCICGRVLRPWYDGWEGDHASGAGEAEPMDVLARLNWL